MKNSKSLRVKKIMKKHIVGVNEPKCETRNFFINNINNNHNNKNNNNNHKNNFVVVIMTYKRVEKLGKILQFLSKFGNEGSLLQNHIIDIVITQSVDEDAPETVVAVEDLLKRYNLKDGISETTLFRSLKHVKVPLMKHDDSFSTDKKMYGNKRNSLQNLKNGLSVALASHPNAKDLLILEDDAVISCDVFEIIKFLRSDVPNWIERDKTNDLNNFNSSNSKNRKVIVDGTVTKSDKGDEKNHIGVFTLDMIFRPSLYMGNYIENIGEQLVPSNEKRINLIRVNPRTTIKTFAYILKRNTAREYVEALDMIDTDADSFDQGGFFYNCNFCEPYCYDHVLEWMLQNKYVLVPDIPRTTQLPGKGMTYKENPITPIYQNVVKQEMFFVSEYKYLGISFFPIIGTSVLTRKRSYFNLATQTTSQVWFWLLFTIVSLIVCCLKCLNNSRNDIERKWGRKKRS